MKLDDRIINPLEIYSPVNVMLAQVYIGQSGIFSNDSQDFENLKNAKLRVLTSLELREGYTKRFCGDGFWYEYFLPLANVEPEKEKKYRPYTLQEFCDKFTVGQPIKFRQKGKVGWERYLILDGYNHEQYENRTVTYIHIGAIPYTLEELFNAYEWQEHYTEDFKPFGVEE